MTGSTRSRFRWSMVRLLGSLRRATQGFLPWSEHVVTAPSSSATARSAAARLYGFPRGRPSSTRHADPAAPFVRCRLSRLVPQRGGVQLCVRRPSRRRSSGLCDQSSHPPNRLVDNMIRSQRPLRCRAPCAGSSSNPRTHDPDWLKCCQVCFLRTCDEAAPVCLCARPLRPRAVL